MLAGMLGRWSEGESPAPGHGVEEMPIFGATFGRGGDDADTGKRELFEEQMTLLKLAWSSDEFSYQSDRYSVPAPGFLNTGNPATGRPWEKVTLVPRPVRQIPIYQAVVSEPTFHYVAKEGHVAIMTLSNRALFGPRWKRFGELVEKYQRRPVQGSDRTHERQDDPAKAVDQQVPPQNGRRPERLVGDALQRQRNQRDDDDRVEDHR